MFTLGGPVPGIIPARWLVEPNPSKCEVRIIYNWIDIEVPRPAPMPLLDRIAGWRRREIIAYVSATDWTARMYDG